MKIKTRFAPSPTGLLHIGGLRTALYCYLFAKQNNGIFLLRIEDTDQARFVKGGVENILRSLEWVGFKPDEGVVLNSAGHSVEMGKHNPYFQSKRLDMYKSYAHELLNKGFAYHCFCTKERLDDLRKTQKLNKLPTGYDGYCRKIDISAAEKRIASGERSVIRMKMPREGVTKFTDMVRGELEFHNNLIDDQIIIKSDGFPTYHFAVVVDDHDMEITHVVRGEEWLSSTPKHLELFRMFGWKPPNFAHLSLLLNPDRSKLSKRHSDVAVEDFIRHGYLPEAMINFVAFLGWNPGSEKELFTMEELIADFSFARVTKSGAVFNLEKLDWYNVQYIRKLTVDELLLHSRQFLDIFSKIIDSRGDAWLKRVLSIVKERLTKLSDLPELIAVFIQENRNYQPDILAWKKSDMADAKYKLNGLIDLLSNFSIQSWSLQNIEAKISQWIDENKYDRGSVLWPFRVALSGEIKSLGPYELAYGLGREETLRRVKFAIAKI